MESNKFNKDYIRNSHEEAKESSGYHKKILKKATSHSYNEESFEKETIENIHHTLRNEDNPQTNIFDHDISINYKQKRHRNLHLKKQISN